MLQVEGKGAVMTAHGHRYLVGLLAAGVVAALAAGTPALAGGHHQAAPSAGSRPLIFRVDIHGATQVKGLASPGQEDGLLGVSAASATDVWAVGSAFTPVNEAGVYGKTVIDHWDGKSWKRVPSPNATGSRNNYLLAVSAVASDDAWAVGRWEKRSGVERTLIEHWDGSTWTVVPSPSPGSPKGYTFLAGVAAISSTSAFAVGRYFDDDTGGHTLIEHWDGTSWTTMEDPVPGNNELVALSATSPSDVWAVGESQNRGLIEHFDGTAWTRVPSPTSAQNFDTLTGVSAISPTNAWAVGFAMSDFEIEHTIVLHWDGTSWTRQASPSPGPESNELHAVSAVGPFNIWAVGEYRPAGAAAGPHALFEHWNGHTWNWIRDSYHGTGQQNLFGVSALAGYGAWAVG
jgi:hypothetical protein